MTTEKFKRDKPDIDTFDSDTETRLHDAPTSPLQKDEETVDETERRRKPAKSATAPYPTPKDVFLKGGNANVSMQMPDEARVKVVVKGEQPEGGSYRHREGAHEYEK